MCVRILNVDFDCANCFHSFETENKLEKHKNNKISKCNLGEKFMKVPFVIYPDLESLLEKMKTCHDNPEKS